MNRKKLTNSRSSQARFLVPHGAIVLLAQQGQLALDDDIRRYLPYVPDLGQTITIRHLVHHISGLRDQWELLTMAGWRLDDVITREHIRKMVQHQQARYVCVLPISIWPAN